MRRFLTSRKLLAASIGVATVTYVACSNTDPGVGNGGSSDAGVVGDQVTGNLMPSDSGNPIVGDEQVVGNLMPAPVDASGDANDATVDAGDDAPEDAPSDSPTDG